MAVAEDRKEQFRLASQRFRDLPADGDPLAALAWLSLRVRCGLELQEQGRFAYLTLEQEFHRVCALVMELEDWEGRQEDAFRAAADAVALTRPAAGTLLCENLPPVMRRRLLRPGPLEKKGFSLLLDLGDFYFTEGFRELGERALRNLVWISEKRNNDHPGLHRACVREAISGFFYRSAELVDTICCRQEKCFQNLEDADAAKFYWVWGCVLRNSGRHEAAAEAFYRSNQGYLATEGTGSWMEANSRADYHAQRMLLGTDEAGEAWLWEFRDRLDRGCYPGENPQTIRILSQQILGQLLNYRMRLQNLNDLQSEIWEHIEFCRAMDGDPRFPQFTLRRGYNLLCACLFGRANYLHAAAAAELALKAPADPAFSDLHFLKTLVRCYACLGDQEKLLHYRNRMAEGMAQENPQGRSFYDTMILLYMADEKLGHAPEEVITQDDRELLDLLCQDIEEGNTEDFSRDCPEASLWVYTVIGGILNIALSRGDPNVISREQLDRYMGVLGFLLEEPEGYFVNRHQEALAWMCLARLCWMAEDPGCLHFLERCLSRSDAMLPGTDAKLQILRLCATIQRSLGDGDAARDTVKQALEDVTLAWQKATAYFNDRRISRMLLYVPANVWVCYGIVRALLSPQERYTCLLRYKDLPALVGRERNRVNRILLGDSPLKNRIFQLQSRIAQAEADAIFRGTEGAEELRQELQKLEMDFYARSTKPREFLQVDADRVAQALPEGAAILEYWMGIGDIAEGFGPFDETKRVMDVFVMTKKEGKTELHTFQVRDWEPLLDMARQFQQILQGEADSMTQGKKEQLRSALYRTLIAPALPMLQGIRELYLAPDSALWNLSFEGLQADGSLRLEERFRVSRLICGRDLLFREEEKTAEGALVIGGPDFEAAEGEMTAAPERDARLELGAVKPLPFSRMEAQRIACRCGVPGYTGAAATKYVLQNTPPRRIIHLATHGYFDRSLETDSLYSSCLVFAGANRWLARGDQSEGCGNGILTADEISRMDLRGTELVVLSACRTGLGDTTYRTFQGLLSAFSAAGVRWVVSHIWKASDFTTPILMDAFYEAYLDMGMEIPQALQYAKGYLKNITVGQLREKGWLDPIPDLPSEELTLIRGLQRRRDHNKPFTGEYYWGGFVCHRCR